ncbi:hypothetical protein ACLOJK_031602 [Asimina triloba]
MELYNTGHGCSSQKITPSPSDFPKGLSKLLQAITLHQDICHLPESSLDVNKPTFPFNPGVEFQSSIDPPPNDKRIPISSRPRGRRPSRESSASCRRSLCFNGARLRNPSCRPTDLELWKKSLGTALRTSRTASTVEFFWAADGCVAGIVRQRRERLISKGKEPMKLKRQIAAEVARHRSFEGRAAAGSGH